ncbi:MAG: hydroxyacid-oxoacid transhydrogenase [Thermomicrobiales bacterium]
MSLETIFTIDTSSIKYGIGATREVGYDLKALGVTRVMLVTDPNLSGSDAVATARKSVEAAGIEIAFFDRVRVEPTDSTFKEAIAFAVSEKVDGFLPVGGGSVIDTAKAANLYSTYPDEFLAYVNAPIGQAKPVPGKLRPLVAIPTTAGTGSETTGTAIFDLVERHVKTGIANRALRPNLGIIDPLNMVSMPPLVTACSALDVLSHAVESYTALPFSDREAAAEPKLRPAYQGSNPISDIWALTATEMMARNLTKTMEHPNDLEARGEMALAAAYAGIGFGNAGVHLPHGMSYPVAGMVRDFYPTDYPSDHPMVPHGMSVILNAPAVFRFTGSALPERHLEAAKRLGADTSNAHPDDAGEILAQAIIEMMKQTGMPSGLAAVGYTDTDIPALVEGTLPQHRVTKLSPRPADRDALTALFKDAMRYW